MKKIFILLSFLISVQVNCQTFYKLLDFVSNKTNPGYEISKINQNEYIISYFTPCDDAPTRCCGLIKIDSTGKILLRKEIPNFSSSSNALYYDALNNNIYYAGEAEKAGSYSTEIVVYKMDKNLEIINSIYYTDTTYNFYSVSQTGIEKFNDEIVILGVGAKEYSNITDTNHAFIYFLDKNLNVDTSLYFNFSKSYNTIPYEVFVDSNNLLNVYFFHNSENEFSRIIKIDSSYNVVWDWEIERLRNNQKPKGCSLTDGRSIFVNSRFPYVDMIEILALNLDKTIDWVLKWDIMGGRNQREVATIKQLKNGDILGVGAYKDSILRQWSPSLFRINNNGKLKWEKVFKTTDSESLIDIGILGDFEELENGDLMCIGRINKEFGASFSNIDDDLFIIRIDSLGCLIENCDLITEIDHLITGNLNEKKIYNEISLELGPNPVSENLEIHCNEKGNLYIYDLTGSVLYKKKHFNKTTEINLYQLSKGIYFVKFVSSTGTLKTLKFIKI